MVFGYEYISKSSFGSPLRNLLVRFTVLPSHVVPLIKNVKGTVRFVRLNSTEPDKPE